MKAPVTTGSALYIFTDASVHNYYDTEFISCSGAIAVLRLGDDDFKIIDERFEVNRCSTNNNGEIKAVYLGLLLATKYKDQFENLYLFSDSKISIYGLREWIVQWTERSSGDTLIGSTNEPVKNQQEILSCLYQIMTNNLNIKLYHQKGHCEIFSNKALRTFKDTNNIQEFVHPNFITFICRMNSYVDNKSRELLMKYVNTITGGPRVMGTPLVQFKYTPFNVTNYLKLVKN